ELACTKRNMGINQNPEGAEGQPIAPDYENKRQVAARLGVSVRTIDNLLTRGLPHVKLTRRLIRFPRAAVDQWLTERQVSRV
ncbi:MAG TPA: helix-turn-helix domain-containing protein, partial [Burkholderiaceae bacterium]|nr:helix-turn-helix domain-containing protein [Burkholderiaceae bacterium]